MSDIFLSYASPDRMRLRPLIKALEGQGWTVFWDRAIAIGQAWPAVLGHELAICSCVVVVWTRSSVQSQWVYEEAEEGKKKSALFPVMLDAVSPPLGFRMFQTADLIGWAGEQENTSFVQLCLDISTHFKRKKLQREQEERQQAAAQASVEQQQRIVADNTKKAQQARQRLIAEQALQAQQRLLQENAQKAVQERERLIKTQAQQPITPLPAEPLSSAANQEEMQRSANKAIQGSDPAFTEQKPSEANAESVPPHTATTASSLPIVKAFALSETHLQQAKQHLAYYLGPVARLLVPRAAKRATTHEHFIQLLASELADEAQRADFIRRMNP